MNILFVSENYFPNVSGVPVVVRYLAEGLFNLGHMVTIATSFYPNTPREEMIGGVIVKRFDLRKNNLDCYSGEIDKYVSFVIEFECDVLIMECLQCAVTDLMLPHLDKIKAKKVLHSHGLSGISLKPFEKKSDLLHTIANAWHWIHSKWFYHYFVPKYIKKVDTVLCLSEVDNTITYCAKYNVNAQVLPNAVEDVFLLPSNPVSQVDIKNLGIPYFLSVAYYSQIKNQLQILDEYYKSGVTDYAMVFIGPSKNEYYERVVATNKEYEKKYGERKVLFLTNVDRAYIPDIIGNATLYLVGSTIEQFSIAMIETMAKGVPFISTNVGNASLLPGGVVVDDISEMNKKILLLLGDQNLYCAYSENGKRYVSENCVRSKVVKQLSNIIESI